MTDFRRIFESGSGLVLVLDPDFRIAAVSNAYLQATMTIREQIVGRGIFEVFPDNPDDPNADGVRNLRASLEIVLETRKPDTMAIQRYDVRRPESEGGGFEVKYWSPVNAPAFADDGPVEYIVHTVSDVTEFVRLEELGTARERDSEALRGEMYLRSQELGEANRRLRAVNEGLVRLHAKVAALTSNSESQLPEKPLTPEEAIHRVAQLVASQQTLQEQLRQAQKMEAIGRFAGGVAHDFNNLLTVITGQASLAEEELRDNPTIERLREVQKAADRAAALTKQLLAFSRKQVLQPRILESNSVVADMENMLGRLIRTNISLVTVKSRRAGRVKADRTQLEQVIMNLVVNARDAMPDGGRLIIETDAVNVAYDGQIATLSRGNYVTISVIDTGHGMDAATRERIFEPFFTTRDPGKGTGLGLATVHGIVVQSGGAITVDSTVGKGTTFRVYLPAVDEMEEDETNGRNATPIRKSSGAILIVEDEPDLRKLISAILTNAGYQTLAAANGEEALRLAKDKRIDLVLTDVMMPGMSVSELANRLRASSSDLVVLFMSGYDRDGLTKATGDPNAIFLPKPFNPQQLLAKIAEQLGSRSDRKGGNLGGFGSSMAC